jgi:hypothetical protein
MALALNTLFDKRRVAMTRARLKAWWEGDEFDAAAAEAALSAEAPANGNADDALFDAPEIVLPPRLMALNTLWGEGRVRPGDDSADVLEVARIGLPAEGLLAVLGPGLAAPIAAVAGQHTGPIEVFEWREETVEALTHGVAKARLEKRVTVTRVDLEAHVWAAGHYDGLWSLDDFAYCSFPPHLAQQIMKCLKPGACAVVESYVGLPCEEFATAFASSFAEPQIRAHGDLLHVLADTGLVLEADEDLTDEFLGMAREGFKQLGERLAQAGEIEPAAARELAWEAEAWRMRLKLLAQRRLERRRLTLRKPSDAAAPAPEAPAQAENANAPEG